MTSTPTPPPAPGTLRGFLADPRLLPFVNYCLMFFMMMSYGLSGLVFLLIATFFIDKAPEWVKTHYRFQIRTFWICIVPVLIFSMARLMVIRSGSDDASLVFLLVLLPLLWTGGRAAMGFHHLYHNRPHPRPGTFLF